MKISGYTRVSTEQQARGTSMETQAEAIIQLCDDRGWDLVEIYEDPGLSGATMERPGLQAMLKDAAAGKFELVLVRDVDRLSRELADFWPMVADLRKLGVGLATVGFPEVTSLQKEFYLMYGGIAGMSQFYREELQKKQRDGMAKAKSEGKQHGRPPLGFETGEDGKLKPTDLGERALEVLNAEPDVSLGKLAEELALKDVNQAYRLKQACLRYLSTPALP